MKKYIIALLLPLALLICSGCGQTGDMSTQPETQGASLWRTAGFASPGKPEEDQSLWAGEYLLWKHQNLASVAGAEELNYLDSGVCGELLWYLGREPGMELGHKVEYVLEIYNTVSEESSVKYFSPEELGLESELGILCSMDLSDKEHFMFRWADYERDEEGMYHQIMDKMVYTDFAGELRTIDIREIYLEKGIYQEEYAEQPSLQVLNWCCDGNGNICVIDYKENGSSDFYLVGQGGEILLEYEGTAERRLVEPLRTPEGELIFPVYDETEKCYDFLWADTAEGELRSLGQMEASYPDIRQMYGMLGDDIYYRSQETVADGIVRWNVSSGRRERVFDFRMAGIDTGYEIMLALREGQTPVLCLTKYKDGKRKEWLAVLTEQKPEDDGAIRVADLAVSGGAKAQVAACAMLASTEFPEHSFEYEDASAQENRDRILIELSQGKGPDLLFVSLEDMYLLEEKGLLLDIGELIPIGLREELLPGALEIGMVDGKLFGVPVAVQADTLAVSADTWSGDTWKLEDVIELMAEGKLTGAIRAFGKYTDPALTVLNLVNHSLTNSFLIDWENRKSHFDDERFVNLLELTNTDMGSVPIDTDTWLNGGKDILWDYFYIEADFLDFFAHMEAENGRIVGYPTEGDCGSYLVADGGVLVVNANIEQKEAAACFLETLLGEELQSKTTMLCMSVRKLAPENYIVEDESGRFLFMGDDNREVPVFREGDTSLHRAKEFLESCVAPPPGYSQITRIIAEELNAMYAENKSPRTTAEIINSRVQLYLDEGVW